jgi:flagellar motor switch protein FliN
VTTDSTNPVDLQAAQLQGIWIECLQKVLSQIAGVPIAVEASAEETLAAAEPFPEKPKVCIVISASKALQGDMAILLPEAGALALAQTLVSEQVNAAVPFDQERRDAYEELVRQVLGQVASSLKQAAGGEVEVKLSGNEAPSWAGASPLGIRIQGEKLSPIQVTLLVSPELAQSLKGKTEAQASPPVTPPLPAPTPPPVAPRPSETPAAAPSSARAPIAPAAAPMAAAPSAAAPGAAPPAARSANLELLLDVRLEASIRFGQKHMLLREILELHPGSAVALDRQVQDPVELLVGGKVVAQGEVVIVDGNYGLRITEILTPQQRIESLGKQR